MGAFEWIIWLLYSLELSENHRFSDGFRKGAELNWFRWTDFVWFRCSGRVPLVLLRYFVDILGCSAGVPGNVKLLRHCSGVLRCSAGVPCSGVPVFLVFQYAVVTKDFKFNVCLYLFYLFTLFNVGLQNS